jgi:hypothetical protein
MAPVSLIRHQGSIHLDLLPNVDWPTAGQTGTALVTRTPCRRGPHRGLDAMLLVITLASNDRRGGTGCVECDDCGLNSSGFWIDGWPLGGHRHAVG